MMPLVLLLVLSCAYAQDTSHDPQCAADVSACEDKEAAEMNTRLLQQKVSMPLETRKEAEIATARADSEQLTKEIEIQQKILDEEDNEYFRLQAAEAKAAEAANQTLDAEGAAKTEAAKEEALEAEAAVAAKVTGMQTKMIQRRIHSPQKHEDHQHKYGEMASTKQEMTKILTSYGYTCKDECAHHGYDYLWCYVADPSWSTDWDYCSLSETTTSNGYNCKQYRSCATGYHGFGKKYSHCYVQETTSWDFCSLDYKLKDLYFKGWGY